MPLDRSELLCPSLAEGQRQTAAPYSLQVSFLSAFFGGPLAAVAMLALNTWRLGRIRGDAVWVGAVALLCIGWYTAADSTALGATLRNSMRWLGGRGEAQVLGLLVYGVGAWLHRKEQRGVELFGLRRPNGWVVGLGLIVVGRFVDSLIREASR